MSVLEGLDGVPGVLGGVLGELAVCGGVLGGLCPVLKYSQPPAATIAQTIREKTASLNLGNNPAMPLDYSYRRGAFGVARSRRIKDLRNRAIGSSCVPSMRYTGFRHGSGRLGALPVERDLVR